jgi:hypothetical protein
MGAIAIFCGEKKLASSKKDSIYQETLEMDTNKMGNEKNIYTVNNRGKESERTHIFAKRLELVLGEMLTLLDL